MDNFNYAEELSKIRRRVRDAVSVGIVKNDNAIFEATLIQIMNEAEKNRQRCCQLQETARTQLHKAEAQEQAFMQVISIVYAVLNGFVVGAERQIQEEEELKKEKEAIQPVELPEKVSKKRNK